MKIKKIHFVYLGLIVVWAALSVMEIYSLDKVMLQLSSSHQINNLQEPKYDRLRQGEKIVGRFTAKYDNLGILAFRFWNFYHINRDQVIFRIRLNDSSQWFYQNQYNTDQFPDNRYFTFGFPVQTDSRGQAYVFEIESVSGTDSDGIAVSRFEPVFETRYKFARNQVFQSPLSVAAFVLSKLENLISNRVFMASSIVYLSPLLYLIILKNPLNKKVKLLAGGIILVYFAYQLINLFDIGANLLLVLANIIAMSAVLGFALASKNRDSFSLLLSSVIIFLQTLQNFKPNSIVTVISIFSYIGIIAVYNTRPRKIYLTMLSFYVLGVVFYLTGNVNLMQASNKFIGWSFIIFCIHLGFVFKYRIDDLYFRRS